MKPSSAIFFLTALLILGGCVSTAVPMASVQDDIEAKRYIKSARRVVLYVYRKDQFEGGAVIYPVFVNGKLVGSLAAGTFLRTEVEPGATEVAAFTQTAQNTVKLSTSVGEIRYVYSQYRVSAGTVLLGVPGNVELREESAVIARNDVSSLAMVNAN